MKAASMVDWYDPYRDSMTEDAGPLFRRLRDEQPVFHHEERGCWIVSRYDDVVAVARDIDTFRCAPGVDLDLPEAYLGPGSFLDLDAPDHPRLRRVVHASFGPRRIEQLTDTIRSQTRRALEPLVRAGGGDIADALAFPLPMDSILGLMGFPEEDGPQLKEWLDATHDRIPGSDARPPACDEAHEQLAAYTERMVALRRRTPGSDLLSLIVAAVDDGVMAPAEVHGMALLLLTAGWGTTAALISDVIYELALREDDRERLKRRDVDVRDVVEEALRFDSPVQHLIRTASREAVLHDVSIPAGGRVLLLYAAANRDDRRWSDPDTFDITRPVQRNLAFGDGVHFCLGAGLARLEARVVLEELFAAVPSFRLAGPVERLEAHVLRGIRHLPLDFQ